MFALGEDRDAALWIGTDRGLVRSHEGKFTAYTTGDGLPDNRVWSLTNDPKGTLWVGTPHGLTRFRDGRFTRLTTSDGLTEDGMISLLADKAGALWIGAYGGGLNRFKDGRFIHYTTQTGLFDDFISRLLEDDRGNVWMSSNQGIFCVSRKELTDYAEGKVRAITSIGYGVADGMAINECNGGGQPAGWKTRDGKLWFPTIQGVVVIDPSKTNALAPPVQIEEVRMAYAATDGVRIEEPRSSTSPSSALEFPPGPGNLEIHYTALSFVAPKSSSRKTNWPGRKTNSPR